MPRPRPVSLAVAALGALLSHGPVRASPAPGPEFSYFGAGGAGAKSTSQEQVLLVVPILNGKEAESSLALLRLPDGRDFVGIEEFLALCAISRTLESDGSIRLLTPLGEATLPAQALRSDETTTYADVAVLSSALAAKVGFDESEFALLITLPWQPGVLDGAEVTAAATATADIRAPRASLSRWRSELVAVESSGTVSASANHRFAGALGSGHWRMEFGHNLTGDDRDIDVGALSWRVDRGNTRLLLGQERVGLHPLLPTFDLTGAQAAWSNHPAQVFDSRYGDAGQLVPYQARPTSVIRGNGPPGGRAELRLGGQVIAQQTIRLDGRYEFRDVPAAPGDAIPVEVAVYAFGETGTPLRVDETYSRAGNLQLAAGTQVHFAGAGQQGFLIDSRRNGSGAAGFYQFRRGFTERMTGELLLQSVDGRQQGVLGSAWNLGPMGSWAAYVGRDENGNGAKQLLGDGERGAWFWRANWLDYDDGYGYPSAADAGRVGAADGYGYPSAADAGRVGAADGYGYPGTADTGRLTGINGYGLTNSQGYGYRIGAIAGIDGHLNAGVPDTTTTTASSSLRAEVGRDLGERLRVSLIHVDSSGQFGRDIRYTRPAVNWRPWPNLHLSARPEYDGRYTFDASWAVRPGTRLSATRFADLSQLAVYQEFGERSRLAVTALRDRTRGDRYSAVFSRGSSRSGQLAWSIGALGGQQRLGFLAEASMELYPGLSARAQVLRDPLVPSQGNVFGVSLVADFAVSGSGLARAGAGSEFSRDGGISGSIERGAGQDPSLDLANIPILINGQVRARSESGGHFHVANIPPGVVRVELDNEGLPIELAVHEPPRQVEVRAGSVTRVDFALELRLGLAGRLIDNTGTPLADIEIIVVDSSAATAARARSNAHGYYRVDGLAPGTYQLRAQHQSGAILAEREATLRDRFLFGQELQLAVPIPETSP